jgi:hypothetical protein
VEAFLALLCALSAPSVMRSARCACTGMVSLFLYGLYFLAKSVMMILVCDMMDPFRALLTRHVILN